MKYILAALAVFAMIPEAKAQEVGTYYLNKSLNKVIVYNGSTAQTLPAPSGSGTTYHYRDLPKVQTDAVCDGWAYIAQRDSKRVPQHVRQRCAAQIAAGGSH